MNLRVKIILFLLVLHCNSNKLRFNAKKVNILSRHKYNSIQIMQNEYCLRLLVANNRFFKLRTNRLRIKKTEQ